MDWYEVINLAATEWAKEGYTADTLLMHPSDLNELVTQLQIGRMPPPPAVGVQGMQVVQLSTQVAQLEIKVSPQEIQGEFVLASSSSNEMRRFTLLEQGEGQSLVIDHPKVLAVKRSQLFLVRTAKNQLISFPITEPREDAVPRWSERLLREVAERYDLVIVFHDTSRGRPGSGVWPLLSLKEKVKELKLHNVGVANYDSSDQLESIQIWKQRIMEVGGRIKRVPNIKDINCFSIPGLTQARHITWVDQNGDANLDLYIEKLKSFMDLAKDRESRSNW